MKKFNLTTLSALALLAGFAMTGAVNAADIAPASTAAAPHTKAGDQVASPSSLNANTCMDGYCTKNL